MESLNTIQLFLVWVVPVLFAITVHEWAHGFVASQFGDYTAQSLGRLSLNPIKHIDPIGTIVVPSLLFFSSGFLFGWAKPVPINTRNLRNAKNSLVWIALAGPSANILMAFFWALLLVFSESINQKYLGLVALAGIQINIILAVLNMLPIPPLDGAKVLERFLPVNFKFIYQKIEPYGFIVLIMLLLTGMLGQIILPTINFLIQTLLFI